MFNSYYIISELNSKIKKNLKKNSNINVIFRSKQKDYNNDTLKKIIRSNIYNKVFIANKNNICLFTGFLQRIFLLLNYIRIENYSVTKKVSKKFFVTQKTLKEYCANVFFNFQANLIRLKDLLKLKLESIKL